MSLPKEEIELYSLISKDFKVVFDIGCRDDIEYYLIKNDCEYHLFEPNTEALNSLKAKIAKLNNPNIIINEFGLSNEIKENQIYYRNVQSFKVHQSVQSIDMGDRFNLGTIDDYVEKNNVKSIDFLKTDCEGMDYLTLLGGKKTIKDDNIVSYLQLEMTSPIKQYTETFDNFNFYLMMEPVLLNAINKLNTTNIHFNHFLTPLTDDIINFIDNVLTPTGNGGNLFGVNKNINFDIKNYIK